MVSLHGTAISLQASLRRSAPVIQQRSSTKYSGYVSGVVASMASSSLSTLASALLPLAATVKERKFYAV